MRDRRRNVITQREADYLRFLITRDPKDLKNWVTEKTVISLARKGFITYVPIFAPSPLRGRWDLTALGRSICG